MYIISISFFDNQPCYLRDCGAFLEKVFDPNFATEFNSIDEADSWIKTKTTLDEYCKVVDKQKSLANFSEWVSKGMVRGRWDILTSVSRPYKNESPEEILQWRLSSFESSVRQEHYRTWPDVYSVFKHIWSVWKDKDLVGGKIYTRKDGKFEEFESELNTLLKYVSGDDWYILSIFDYRCGEGGDFANFHFKSSSECKIASRWHTLCEGSLKDCFEYMKKDRYYD